MKVSPPGIILPLLLSAFFLAACGNVNNDGNGPAQTRPAGENTNAARTNVEELSLLVRVPYEAEDIVWKEDAAHRKIIAVLRFKPEDANKIVVEAEKSGAPQNVAIAVETWFPDELIAQGEMSGDNALKGLAYGANDFYLAPYTSGRITRIEASDYFVLEVSAT